MRNFREKEILTSNSIILQLLGMFILLNDQKYTVFNTFSTNYISALHLKPVCCLLFVEAEEMTLQRTLQQQAVALDVVQLPFYLVY